MECPYLEEGMLKRVCNASVTRMTPGVEETSTYCVTEEHYRCPVLLAHILRGNAPLTGVFA